MEDRVENLVSGDDHGPDRVYTTRVAVPHDGLLQALDIYVIEDAGAYGGRVGIRKPVTALSGPYRVPHIRYQGDLVFTCKTNQVPFRGAGQAPHNFMLERTVDLLARDLGIDRVELRLKTTSARTSSRTRRPVAASTTPAITKAPWNGCYGSPTSRHCAWSRRKRAVKVGLSASASPAAWSPVAPRPADREGHASRSTRAVAWSRRSASNRPARATRLW